MIKIITKASKVSKRNMIKSLNIVKKFMKMLRIMLREEHLRNGFSIEYFLLFEAIFKCGRIIYWFFDKWIEFCEKLLGANFTVVFFFFIFICQVIWAIFEFFIL